MSELARLSRFLVFVPYGDEVEVQHTVKGTVARIGRAEHARLLEYRGFQKCSPGDAALVDRGWLVEPGGDTAERHGGLIAGTEARLDRDYLDWYWAREVESERELRWLGVVVLKMPTDLFVYQALIVEHGIRSVLEVGSGDGGGLWFFASILSLAGGGVVVGVERDPPKTRLPFERWAGVEVRVEVGDALDEAVNTAGYALVVIDVGRGAEWSLVLRRWAGAVADGGFLVVEDIDGDDWVEIDAFLVERREFGIEPLGLPMRKGVVLQRLRRCSSSSERVTPS